MKGLQNPSEVHSGVEVLPRRLRADSSSDRRRAPSVRVECCCSGLDPTVSWLEAWHRLKRAGRRCVVSKDCRRLAIFCSIAPRCKVHTSRSVRGGNARRCWRNVRNLKDKQASGTVDVKLKPRMQALTSVLAKLAPASPDVHFAQT